MVNVALFGSSHYITPIFERLLQSNILRLKLFVTKPESFKQNENENLVEIIRSERLDNAAIKTILHSFKHKNIQLGIVADYGIMIPEKIISAPTHGLINIHFSKLPQFRGASPVQYTILQGLPNAAISIIEMTADDIPKVDSGKIIFQKEYPLLGSETTESLYTDLFQKASAVIENVIIDYTNKTLLPFPQDHAQKTFTTPTGKFNRTTLLTKEDAFVSAQHDPIYIERAVRAFTPWPRTWTTLGNVLQIGSQFDPTISKLRKGKNETIRVQLLKAHLQDNKLVLDELQADGKKSASWKEFKNGYFE